MRPPFISRIAWDTERWTAVQPDEPVAFGQLDFASTTPLASDWKVPGLHWADPQKPRPDFPFLHPAVMLVPSWVRAKPFNPFCEVCYELLPCMVEGEEWSILNILWCPPRALDEARTTWQPDPVTGEPRPVDYVFNRMGRTDPFFKIWQTSDREILLNSEADPKFPQWCAGNRFTGLRYEKLFTFGA